MDCVKLEDMYQRAEYQIIKSRLQEDRSRIQVVTGPRQVGKSTVVKQVLQDIDIPYLLFSADNVPNVNRNWISDCWNSARTLKDNKSLDTIILVIFTSY